MELGVWTWITDINTVIKGSYFLGTSFIQPELPTAPTVLKRLEQQLSLQSPGHEE